jgi:hypothetical protein
MGSKPFHLQKLLTTERPRGHRYSRANIPKAGVRKRAIIGRLWDFSGFLGETGFFMLRLYWFSAA